MPAAVGGGGGNWSRQPDPPGTNLVDPATGNVQPSGLSGWTLKMSEEFGGSMTVLDSPNGLVKFRSDGPTWKCWYPNDTVGDGNQHSNNPGTEKEWYDTSRVSLVSGALQFDAVQDNVHSGVGLPYTSGLIQSNPSFNQKYGFFEAKLKVDGLHGSWGAFWLIAASYNWPPEVDIMENFGVPDTFTTSNFGSGASVFGDPHSATMTNYNTFGVKWDATHLTYYLNGSQVDNETATGSIPQEPLYVVLNLAVNGTDFSAYSMQVDYVRVWQ